MEHKITDADFWKTFAIISVIIIVLTIFIAIMSNVFASYSSSGDDNYKNSSCNFFIDNILVLLNNEIYAYTKKQA